ncbi:TNF receptor-associated factor 2-like isoform X2 [Ptychodera flava]|uniref:TNF receptor-associated factor 2-like isoform X2 n=1 Tax=Ptychodera flava TaxID=63121 RepID=UPI00396A2C9D
MELSRDKIHIQQCQKNCNDHKQQKALTSDESRGDNVYIEEQVRALLKRIEKQTEILARQDAVLVCQSLRIQSLESTSYNGILVWKISGFAKKIHEAVTGQTPSIYSQFFFTSRFGYKMCARVYLNGDGIGKGTHVSLFFVIMKGEFDAILQWPFRQKVTFLWLSQGNRDDISHTFRPDQFSASFVRPKQDMNVASGCPLFMPLQLLADADSMYVKNDTVYLKVLVEDSR